MATTERGARRWRSFLKANWDLGFTAFGGPPVHFKIFHDRFVVKEKWLDEQSFQELFSVSQALSGPASTKMLYCINLTRHGTLAAVISFLLWTLPAATVMFLLSLGVANIDSTLPGPAYAFLSGLNASVVGVIALATTELSSKAVTDGVTRLIVFGTASAGMLYSAVWYFPVLMAFSGLTTLSYDLGLVPRVWRSLRFWKQHRRSTDTIISAYNGITTTRPHNDNLENGVIEQNYGTLSDSERQPLLFPEPTPTTATNSPPAATSSIPENHTATPIPPSSSPSPSQQQQQETLQPNQPVTPQTGLKIITAFLTLLALTILLRTFILPPNPNPNPNPNTQNPQNPPSHNHNNLILTLNLSTTLFQSGTLIFGGGPVVVPLLRESMVMATSWVSERDFLIGLAIIQALPGPNFNFAVFLGGLTFLNHFEYYSSSSSDLSSLTPSSLTSSSSTSSSSWGLFSSSSSSSASSSSPLLSSSSSSLSWDRNSGSGLDQSKSQSQSQTENGNENGNGNKRKWWITTTSTALWGATAAWLAIFLPGMMLVHGTMGVWGAVRERRPVRAALRGVNAGAVGLVFTAVSRIWGVGFLDGGGSGRSLGDDPLWLVIAAGNYVFGRWYRVTPPVTIVSGALLGLLRYQVVSTV